MKTLWIVGGGFESVPGIKHAKAMGLHVVVSDGNPSAPGFAFADEQIVASTYDAKLTARLAKQYAASKFVHGVIAMCTDVPVTVAAVAKALGLQGLSLDVAKLGADKVAMKEWLMASGIPTAWGCVVDSIGQIRRLTMHRPGAYVVKPVDSRGARGVTRLSDTWWPRDAFQAAMEASPTHRVMIEEWLDGPQISTEAVMFGDGQGVVCGFLDRNYAHLNECAPYVIEDGADGPTRLKDVDRAAVEAAFLRAAFAVVGLTPCTVKGDMVLTPTGPKVIELALRLSGGHMSTRLIPEMTGVDLVGLAIQLALREDFDRRRAVPHANRGGAIRFVIPPGCKSHPERKGHAIAFAATREEAIRRAEDAIRATQIPVA